LGVDKMPTRDDVLKDPEFWKLPQPEQKKVLQQIDPEFTALPDIEQDRVISMVGQKQAAIQPQQQAPEKQQWYDLLGEMVLNVPGSAYQFGADIFQAVAHPIETGKGMGRAAMGAIEKTVPGSANILPGPQYGRENIAAFDSLVDYFSDRYGSVENFKQATVQDPVGVMADVASVFSGAGGALRGSAAGMAKTGQALTRAAPGVAAGGRVGRTIAPVMSAAGQVGIQAAPGVAKVGETMQKVGAPLTQAFKKIPTEKLYESAAKWSTAAQKPGETGKQVRQRLTRTALENRIMPTYAGLNKLQDKMDNIGQQINKLVESATQTGQSLDAGELIRGFTELEKDVWQYTSEPVKNVRQIKSIKEQFRKAHGIFNDKGQLVGYKSLTPNQAQKIKVNIYEELESFYEKVKSSPVKVKAKKLMARAAKEFLEEVIPEIEQLNKQYGPLKELRKALDRAAGRIQNRDLMGIGLPIKGGAGYAVTGAQPAGAVAGAVWGLLDTPKVKAKLALLINGMQKRGISISPTESAIALGLFQTGRAGEIVNE
jgi:hypothetical protein